jgi:hypothetical protein
MTKEQIQKWLDSLHQDREWLAAQTGTQKCTVDSWFSKRGFPGPALKQIERLYRETTATTDGKFRVQFDTEEFERIDAARKLVGEPPRPEFYRNAIIDFADRILANEANRPQNVINYAEPKPPETESARVAETPPRRKKSAH